MAQRKCKFPNSNDREILNFIWKWKIASTSALAVRFHKKKWAPATLYWRLRGLKRSGWIKTEPFSDGELWTLTHEGFDVISLDMPALVQKGFASEAVRHDLISQAVHLGDFLPEENQTHELVSEQELRRIHPECLPDWVPPQRRHRPDGYWSLCFGVNRRTIALEVELSIKTNAEYEKFAFFYGSARGIESVLWVIASSNIGSRIYGSWPKNLDRSVSVYNFVRLEDFLENGWGATIEHGSHKGQTIRAFLDAESSHLPPELQPLFAKSDLTKSILCTNVRTIKSSTYKTPSNRSEFCFAPPKANRHKILRRLSNKVSPCE